MPEVEFVHVALAHFATEPELVFSHVVRHNVGQHTGDVIAPRGGRDAYLFKSTNRDARGSGNRLAVNERGRTREQTHGMHIAALIRVIERRLEGINAKPNLV